MREKTATREGGREGEREGVREEGSYKVALDGGCHHTVLGGRACMVTLSQPLRQVCVFTTRTAPDLIPSPLNPCSLRNTSQ